VDLIVLARYMQVPMHSPTLPYLLLPPRGCQPRRRRCSAPRSPRGPQRLPPRAGHAAGARRLAHRLARRLEPKRPSAHWEGQRARPDARRSGAGPNPNPHAGATAQVFSPEFCERHAAHTINIHHSFLPAFEGALGWLE